MRALAWDDEKEYIGLLKKYLEKYGIEVVVAETEQEFSEKFVAENWDFVITDLLLEKGMAKGAAKKVGIEIARRVAERQKDPSMPIFMVTKEFERLTVDELPPNVIAKSKSSFASWTADEIYRELKRRGVFVDRDKVFLIYGNGHNAPGTTERLTHFLRGNKIDVVEIGPDTSLQTEILQGLLNKMNECAAFIALCTPDDRKVDGTITTFWPRPNVLIEIGMALGLSRGLQRLLIIQRWGPSPEDQAQLPSDLGGILTHRFEGKIESHFETLRQKLISMGVKFEEIAPTP